ncbi:hypothetical protein [Pseudomonas syringae]|uniref:hypothetical protein n=1 Tax=Pseudomonas syringae TaxID=317 RepID=UPI000A25C886|nr:hypothetical protein [Pseudomonas syringae]MBL3606640.1 hypothetical protein [Pseudomonas syringae pv. actinidiae]OSR78036.1 hypothetical protein BV327_01165 [Pseudomonas syringae pv. actinidiae]OSS32660.1 hypothetical protein BV337_00495 [Pseudomonas syringae pv. actinidiae]
MFETHEEAFIQSFFCSDPGLLEWRFVTQRFTSEWFYISQHYIEVDTQCVAKRMLLIDDINEFKALVSTKSVDSWVDEVFLVTPKSINGIRPWSVDLLLEIREYEPDPNFLNRNYIYKVDGSSPYFHSTELDGYWENLEFDVLYRNTTCPQLKPSQTHWAFSEDQTARIEQIILAGIELFYGNYLEGVRWATTKVNDLGYRCPLEMVDPEGFCQVIGFIERLKRESNKKF